MTAVGLVPGSDAGDAPDYRTSTRDFLSPLVRQLLRKHGLDVRSLTGTGRDGRIRKQDVQRYVREATPERGPQSRAQDRTPAGRPAPQAMSVQVDLTAADRPGSSAEVRLRRAATCVWAATRALAGSDNEGTRGARRGRASREWVKRLALRAEKSADMRDLTGDTGSLSYEGIERLVASTLDSDAGSTAVDEARAVLSFTDSSGMGVLSETMTLTPEQSADLALGAVVRQPTVVEGDKGEVIAIRSVSYLTLTYRPDALDREAAADFLNSVRHHLQSCPH